MSDPINLVTPHLTRDEIRCRCGCGKAGIDFVTAVLFEKIRKWCGGVPMTVTSCFRCETHNRNVGGSPNSMHLSGRAIDFVHPNLTPMQVLSVIESNVHGQFGIGTYPSKGFTHADSGNGRRWRG